MIVNHTTGASIGLRALLALYPSIAAAGNPRIGTDGIRGPWSSPPTDAELRTVNHSILAETAPVPHATKTRELIDDVWTEVWTPITDDALRAQIIVEIKDAARQHILAVLPEWKQTNMLARATQLAEIREQRETTAEEAAQHQALRAAWAWVQAVRSASDLIESDVAQMTRAALLAWAMPALPGWGS